MAAKVVKNTSDGYGYKYSSLADLHENGIEVPVMKTQYIEGHEYVMWLDKNGNWQQGARVVPFAAKGMNEPQAYGASLTYARRYTVQLAMQVVCDDDKEIESKPAAKPAQRNYSGGINFEELKENCGVIDDRESLTEYYKETLSKIKKPTEKQRYAIDTIFQSRMKEIDS